METSNYFIVEFQQNKIWIRVQWNFEVIQEIPVENIHTNLNAMI